MVVGMWGMVVMVVVVASPCSSTPLIPQCPGHWQVFITGPVLITLERWVAVACVVALLGEAWGRSEGWGSTEGLWVPGVDAGGW